VPYIGWCVSGDQYLLVLQLAANGSLEALQQRRGVLMAPSGPERARLLQILKDAAAGLMHLHRQGVVHRDLACRNILVSESWRGMLADLGLARVLRAEGASGATGSSLGPVPWMAPESIASRKYSAASDVFMFAQTIWEALAGRTPYASEPVDISLAMAVVQGRRPPPLPAARCPPQLQTLLEQCWETEPAKRPSIEQVHAVLEQLLAAAGPPPSLPGAAASSPPAKPSAERAEAPVAIPSSLLRPDEALRVLEIAHAAADAGVAPDADYAAARELERRACVEAMSDLAAAATLRARARALYATAASARGHAASMGRVAMFAMAGLGGPCDHRLAHDMAAKGAAAGDAQSVTVVAGCQQSGMAFFALDMAASREGLDRAAGTGGEWASVALASLLSAMRSEPERVAALVQAALPQLVEASRANDPLAQRQLGALLVFGIGVRLSPAEGVVWLRRAGEQGSNAARMILGLAYFDGRGVQRDAALGAALLTRACEARFAPAQFSLGKMLIEGRRLPRDEARAMQLIREAAESGFAPAMVMAK
jgi:TPR repeat protein